MFKLFFVKKKLFIISTIACAGMVGLVTYSFFKNKEEDIIEISDSPEIKYELGISSGIGIKKFSFGKPASGIPLRTEKTKD